MSLSHILIVAIVVLIVVPPEKLPELMRNLGRLISDIKRQTNGIFSDVKSDLNEFKDLKKDIQLTPDDMLKKLNEKKPDEQ